MVVTMLEAQVPDEASARLIEAFDTMGSEALPPEISESFLVRESGTDTWRIVTVWVSMDALENYRQAVDIPGGVLMFRSVGAEPSLSIHKTEAHVAHA
jgi:hypothetical protein